VITTAQREDSGSERGEKTGTPSWKRSCNQPEARKDAHLPYRLVTPPLLLVTFFLVSSLFLSGLGRTPSARDFPPAVPAPQAMVLPAAAVRILPNGLKVVVLERRGVPVVTLDLAVKTGSEADPPNLPGTADFVASLLDEGTQTRTAQQIAEALDSTGATLDTGAEWDDSYATITALSSHIRVAFDILSDIFVHPSFEPAEVERIRTQTLSALDILRQDPEYLADTLVEEIAFQGTPYSHPANGVVESIKRISAQTLQQFHARYYQPSNAVLVAVGDLSAANGFALAQSFFGRWQNSQPVPRIETSPGNSSPERRIVAIDDPSAVQTVIRIANRAVERDSSDYPALTVANQVLGGPAENLLFSALRTRRGLVYGASSDLDCYRIAGVWEEKTATRTTETLRAVQVMLDQMKSLRGHALGPWELENAQDYLVGHMALDLESFQDVADRLLELLTYSLPVNDWNQFPQKIRQLQVSDVRTVIRSYLKPEDAVIVLVGNLSGFKKELEKLGPVEIIPLSRVDLASESLRGKPAGALAARKLNR
jgi:zinc protease